MILNNHLKKRNFLCKFGVIFILGSILLFDEGAAQSFKYFDALKYVDELEIDSQGEDENGYRYQRDHKTYNENEHYPYQQLLKIIKQTKKLLLSNEGDRNILKFDAKYDDAYIIGDNKRHFYNDYNNNVPTLSFKESYRHYPNFVSHRRPSISKSGRRKNTKLKICGFIKENIKPQHLTSMNGKSHLIFNLGDDFVQEVTVTKCAREELGKVCGNSAFVPELYKDVCEQSYGIYKLFSIPEGEKIDISNQVVANFKLPNGCNCKRKRE